MQKSSFFNSISGDRRYKAEEWAEYFSSFIGNGIFPNPSTNLMVQAGTGMNISILPGKAWINGYFYQNTEPLTTQLDTADGILKRIDRVVVCWSLADRSISVTIKKGANSSTPAAPALQRDADVYELALGDILVGNGVVALSQANITDQRLNTELCGIVTQTVVTIDTSQYTAQLNTLFSEAQAAVNGQIASLLEQLNAQLDENQAEFEAWFATIQNILDKNAAGNLFNLIEQHKNDTAPHVTSAEKAAWNALAAVTDFMRTSAVQTMSEKLVAGGALDETAAQVRNAVILPSTMTDFSAVPNKTLIFTY
ncbi:hypothetical protein [Acetanaerobacterium elongatum]|uniref:Uncharacterized protein n=1 Tax=Acetanaerobacterium elongatum TaxID=258515 RepID=A0A1H0EAC7_9FIRM|nr:hypothetical protein [Acetanaerobacterium elongatum]SDN79283.1 hypothetical protein SAMN05192585_13231 [Acetanaerobacterium elongatum]